jgi:hypothetical protein
MSDAGCCCIFVVILYSLAFGCNDFFFVFCCDLLSVAAGMLTDLFDRISSHSTVQCCGKKYELFTTDQGSVRALETFRKVRLFFTVLWEEIRVRSKPTRVQYGPSKRFEK